MLETTVTLPVLQRPSHRFNFFVSCSFFLLKQRLKLNWRYCTCRDALTNGFSEPLPGPASDQEQSMCWPCQFCSRSGSLQGLVLVIGANHEIPGPWNSGRFSFLGPVLTFSTGTNHETPIGNIFKKKRVFIFFIRDMYNIGSQQTQLSEATMMPGRMQKCRDESVTVGLDTLKLFHWAAPPAPPPPPLP